MFTDDYPNFYSLFNTCIMRRFLTTGIILLISLLYSFTIYSSSLKGRVIDKESAEPLPFVNIILETDTGIVSHGQSDFDGLYEFNGLKPGKFVIKVSSIGYQASAVSGIIIAKNETKWLEVKMQSSAIEMQEFVIVQYKNKVIDKGNTAVKRTISHKDFRKMGRRSKNKVAQNTAGVYSADDGSTNVNIRGARSNANYYYIDGMKVLGSNQLPTTPPPSRDNYEPIVDNVFTSVSKEPLSTFSVDVDKASYTNIRRYINQGYKPPQDAVRIEEMVNYFQYDYPQPTDQHPFSITTEYTDCPWNTKHKLVHIGIQGKEVELETAPPNNLVFLIDVSGSMSSQDKLGLVKIGFNLLVDQMRPEDRVAIVVYAGAAGLVLESTSGENSKEIKNAINRLEAGGSTAGGAGIELAYLIAEKNFIEQGNNRIVLASDGDFNVGISSTSNLIKLIESKRDKDIFLTTLGFGRGNLNDVNMEQLANKGNGNYNYIDNAMEAKKVFMSELGANLITIAKDVKVQVEFNPSVVKGYKLIGYVNRKLENEDFNNDLKDAGEIGSGHSVTMMYEIIPSESDEKVMNIDELKYQQAKEVVLTHNDEVLTVKFRYKPPKGKTSTLITHVLENNIQAFDRTSNNVRFSSSVACFGMLLRGSFKDNNFSYNDVIKLAKNSYGKDEDGSKREFIDLVQLASAY